MNALIGFLHSELGVLSAEAKRRNLDIKESIERAFVSLTRLKESAEGSVSEGSLEPDLSKLAEIIQPLLLVSQCKAAKMVAIAIGCLQKLITHKALIHDSIVHKILAAFQQSVDNASDVQLKILQALLPLLSNYPNIHHERLAPCFLICFHLSHSKITMIQNSASATLRQLCVYLFERMEKDSEALPGTAPERPSGEASEEHSPLQEATDSLGSEPGLLPNALDAFCLFKDLCYLANGEKAPLMGISGVEPAYALELIESVVGTHPSSFRGRPEFLSLLKDLLCPSIHQGSKPPASDYTLVARVFRLYGLLIREFSETLPRETAAFLSALIKTVEWGTHGWQRVLSLEVLRGLFQDFQLVLRLEARSSRGAVLELLRSLESLIHSYHTGADGASTTRLSVHSPVMKTPWIDVLERTEPAANAEPYSVLLAFQVVLALLRGGAELALSQFREPGALSLPSESEPELSSGLAPPSSRAAGFFDPDRAADSFRDSVLYRAVREGLDDWWSRFHSILFSLYVLPFDDPSMQIVFYMLKSASLLCACFGLVDARDAFLLQWTKVAIGPILACHGGETMTKANASAEEAKAFTSASLLLHTSYSMSRMMTEEAAWHPVVELLLAIERVRKTIDFAGKAGDKEELSLLLQRSLDRLYVESAQFSAPSWLAFIFSFGSLLKELLVPGLSSSPAGSCHWKSSAMQFRWLKSAQEKECLVFIHRYRQTLVANVARFLPLAAPPDGHAFERDGDLAWEATIACVLALLQSDLLSEPLLHELIALLSSFAEAFIGRLGGSSALAGRPLCQLQLLGMVRALVDPTANQSLVSRQEGLKLLLSMMVNYAEGWTADAAWGLILALLHSLPKEETECDGALSPDAQASSDGSLMMLGFPCLQWIATEALSCLTAPLVASQANNPYVGAGAESGLGMLIATLGEYTKRTLDLNLALTSIALLWNVSDEITRRRKEPEGDIGLDGLLCCLLKELLRVTCSTPTREEIRDSGLQTLLRTIKLHLESMPEGLWHCIIDDILLPLLGSVLNLTFKEGKGSAADEPQLSVFESQSLLYALTGLSELLGGEGRAIASPLPPSSRGSAQTKRLWAAYFSAVRVATLYGNTKIRVGVLKAFQGLVRLGNSQALSFEPDCMWMAWETLAAICRRIPCPPLLVPSQMPADNASVPSPVIELAPMEARLANEPVFGFDQECLHLFAATLNVLLPQLETSYRTLACLEASLSCLELILLGQPAPHRPCAHTLNLLQSFVLGESLPLLRVFKGHSAVVLSRKGVWIRLGLCRDCDIEARMLPVARQLLSTLAKDVRQATIEHEEEFWTSGVLAKLLVADLAEPLALKHRSLALSHEEAVEPTVSRDAPAGTGVERSEEPVSIHWTELALATRELIEAGLASFLQSTMALEAGLGHEIWSAIVIAVRSMLSYPFDQSALSRSTVERDEESLVDCVDWIHRRLVSQYLVDAKTRPKDSAIYLDIWSALGRASTAALSECEREEGSNNGNSSDHHKQHRGGRGRKSDGNSSSSLSPSSSSPLGAEPISPSSPRISPSASAADERTLRVLRINSAVMHYRFEKLAYRIWRLFFSSVSKSSQAADTPAQGQLAVGQTAFQIWIGKTRIALQSYIEAKRSHGNFPLSRLQQEFTLFLLGELLELELLPGLQIPSLSGLALPCEDRHLFLLYPRLVACLTLKDDRAIAILQRILERIGKGLSLPIE